MPNARSNGLLKYSGCTAAAQLRTFTLFPLFHDCTFSQKALSIFHIVSLLRSDGVTSVLTWTLGLPAAACPPKSNFSFYFYKPIRILCILSFRIENQMLLSGQNFFFSKKGSSIKHLESMIILSLSL